MRSRISFVLLAFGAQMAIDAQGDPNVRYAAMGAYGTDGSSNYDDYFWGKGTTGPDIWSIGGYWKISAPA
jgi:cbb3-type cytochrome oxidase cytochrome c subunit